MTSPSLSETIKKHCQSVLLGFYYSNLLIAFAAAALSLQTWLFVDNHRIDWTIVIISGLCTYLFYGLHYWFDRVFYPAKALQIDRGFFFDKYKTGLLGVFGVSAIALVILFWQNFTQEQYVLFLVLGSISLLYSFKIFNLFGLQRLKNNRWLKLIILSGIWAAITVLLWWPKFEDHWDLILLFLSRWAFMMAVCVPFDLRDTFYDRHNMTTPTLYDSFGLKPLLRLSLISLVISYILIYFVTKNSQTHWSVFFILGNGYQFTGWLILKTFKQPKKDWNYFYLDLHLIFYPLLMLLAYHFN